MYWVIRLVLYQITARLPSQYQQIMDMNTGETSYSSTADSLAAWALKSGDVSAPAAVWLFASGLVALIGVARRKERA
jgi:hypothetical protein